MSTTASGRIQAGTDRGDAGAGRLGVHATVRRPARVLTTRALHEGILLATLLGVIDLVDHTLGPVTIPATHLLIVAPLVTAARSGAGVTALVGAYSVLLAALLGPTHATVGGSIDELVLIAIAAAGSALAVLIARVRERAEWALRDRTRELEQLQAVADVALEHTELDDVLPRLLTCITTAVRADEATILLGDGATAFECYASSAPGHEGDGRVGALSVAFARRVASERRPVMIGDVSQELRDGSSPGVRQRDLCSLVGAPLITHDRVMGVIEAGAAARDHFTDRDTRLLSLAAQRAALAIARAQLYDRERSIAETLQAGLLPADLPEIEGLEIAAAYRAAGGEQVGGDFYDIFRWGADWCVTIGDITGKGAVAASTTALARYTLQEAAAHVGRPAAALSRLNDAIRRERSPEEVCSAICARLSAGHGTAQVDIAVAGHPPPLVMRRGGVERVTARGPLLGATAAPRFGEQSVLLEPGDALVLYTDGVTEMRTGDGRLGVGGFTALLEECGGLSPSRVLDRLAARFVGAPAGSQDDTALVVLRLRDDKENEHG